MADGRRVGDGLTTAHAYAIQRFRENGGGVLTARGHHDLGRCLSRLGSLGVANEFHTKTVDAWPNYHSGASGDYQPVLVEVPVHELLRTNQTASGRIEWFPAHPHEGLVSAKSPFATAIARGRSTATGRHFNLAAVIDGERGPDGRPMGRAVAESTLHHFADYNSKRLDSPTNGGHHSRRADAPSPGRIGRQVRDAKAYRRWRHRPVERLHVTVAGGLVVLGRAVGGDAVEHAGGLADLDEISVGIA